MSALFKKISLMSSSKVVILLSPSQNLRQALKNLLIHKIHKTQKTHKSLKDPLKMKFLMHKKRQSLHLDG